MSREWTETHIRELIKRELKKNKGSGFNPICLQFGAKKVYNDLDPEITHGEIYLTASNDNIHVFINNLYIPSSTADVIGVITGPLDLYFGSGTTDISNPLRLPNYFNLVLREINTSGYTATNGIKYYDLYNLTGRAIIGGSIEWDYNINNKFNKFNNIIDKLY